MAREFIEGTMLFDSQGEEISGDRISVALKRLEGRQTGKQLRQLGEDGLDEAGAELDLLPQDLGNQTDLSAVDAQVEPTERDATGQFARTLSLIEQAA